MNGNIVNRGNSVWWLASSRCKEEYGSNSSLLELTTSECWKSLEKLYSSGSIKPDKYYSIGLKKRINSSEETCITTNVVTETNVTDYRVRECFSLSCSGHPRNEGYGRCDANHHPVCVKDAKNVSSGK